MKKMKRFMGFTLAAAMFLSACSGGGGSTAQPSKGEDGKRSSRRLRLVPGRLSESR